jgi:hypothetical protein
MKKNKKYIIGGLVIAFLLYFRSKASAGVVNGLGITIIPGKTYRSRAGFTVYNTGSLTAFATTGSNANFLITALETATINNTLKQMARVTYVDNYGDVIHEWEFLIDINALTT